MYIHVSNIFLHVSTFYVVLTEIGNVYQRMFETTHPSTHPHTHRMVYLFQYTISIVSRVKKRFNQLLKDKI